MSICRKYRLIPQKYDENNNNMAYGGGYLWLWGVWFCGGCKQAINRFKINILFWRKLILISRTPRSDLGQSLTLTGYISGLPDISEGRRLLFVFNANRPVPRVVENRIMSTSTNSVAVVYHIFYPFAKVQI